MTRPGFGTQPLGTSSMGGARNITVTVSGVRARTVTATVSDTRTVTATLRAAS